MSGKVKGVPDNSSVVIPRLVCRDPAAAIDFCAEVLGTIELNRRPGPDGTVAHALMTIGPAMIMIEGEWPTLPSRAPPADGSRGGADLGASARPVLGRPHRVDHGPIRARMDHCDTHRRDNGTGANGPMVGGAG